MIRVAQVVRPAEGGIRRHVSSLLANLDPSEFVCTLFAPQDLKLEPHPSLVRHVPTPIGAVTSPLRDLTSILRLRSQLRGNFDLVHCHGVRAALIGVTAARLAGVPAIFTAHNQVPRCGPALRAVLRVLCNSAVIVAVSNAVAGTIVALGIDKIRIVVVPNGVDVAEFGGPKLDLSARMEVLTELVRTANWCGNSNLAQILNGRMNGQSNEEFQVFAVGAVGRLSPEKGFDVLVDGFTEWIAHSSSTDAHVLRILIIVGAGRDAAALRQRAHSSQNIILSGSLPVITPLMKALDIVVVPSRKEGQGIVALEAMAASRPVVASNVGGLPESVVQGVTGLLVPPDDPPSLAAALDSLFESSELRERMGAAGRDRVEDCFTLNAMVQKISDLYRGTSKSPAVVRGERSR